MPPIKRRESLRRVRWSNRTRRSARVDASMLYPLESRLVRQLFGGFPRGSAQAEPDWRSSKSQKVPIPQKNGLTNRLAAQFI